MKSFLGQRSGNPALRPNTFDGFAASADPMTLNGTVDRCFALAFLLLAGVGVSIVTGPALVLPAALAGLAVAIVTAFRRAWSPVTAPIYALLEGAVVGAISILYEHAYAGIVIPAISLTIGIFLAFLLIYRSHLIPVTDRLRLGIVAATAGVAIVYLADLGLALLGVRLPLLNEAIAGSGALGIGMSVLVIGIAAFNLLLDFDLIERGVELRAPKYMEWYAAFGLLVTLVWLYLEILRLLARTRRR